MGSLGGLCWLVGGQVVLAKRSETTFGELLAVELTERFGGLRCDVGFMVSSRVSVGCSPP